MDTHALWNSELGWLTWLPLAVIAGVIILAKLRPGLDQDSNGSGLPVTEQVHPGGGTPQRPTQSVIVWWVMLISLIGWSFAGIFTHHTTPTVAKIPYSTFVTEIKSGNVDQIGIQGSEIIGKLRKPREWNRQTGLFTDLASEKNSLTTHESMPTNDQPAIPVGTQPNQSSAPASPVQVVDFTTVFPSSVGDPQLLPLLESQGVEIIAVPKAPAWFSSLLGTLLPIALLIGFFWWMGRRAMKQQQSIFGTGQSQARRFNREQAPAVTFADVAGADAAKGQLKEIVSILKAPERYRALGARIPRGVLLAGPPGTGKTLLARAVAGEAQVPFFSISGSEFVEMFVGVGASRVRNLFKETKAAAPAILFVDELDAVGRRRGAGIGQVNDEREQTLNQLLVEMDGFDDRTNVIVLAATNRPDVLDPALRRPGRFDREVMVGLPDLAGRRGILGIHSRHLALAGDVDLNALAAITMGMSGAQLANLCNEAALVAAREAHTAIERADFEAALDRIVLGDVRPLALDPTARRVISYHESGHALVAWLNPQADPVHKVTIVPHGMALGVTEQRPAEERYNLSRNYLNARLHVMLGGRSAEEIAIGEITTGAENDLIQATQLARRMVTSWGMSELGLTAYDSSSEDRFLGYELGQGRPYSEDTARRIDAEVERLLDDSHSTVLNLLESAHDRLDQLAAALLEKETVEYDELVQLLGPRPAA